MSAVAGQLELIGRQRPVIPDDEQWRAALACKNRNHAIRKCVELANFEFPKEVYMPLGIDQGLWSRIWAGTAFLNPDLKFPLMELCGNVVPVLYDVWKCGFNRPERVKTDLEAKLAASERENEDLRRTLQLLAQARFGQ